MPASPPLPQLYARAGDSVHPSQNGSNGSSSSLEDKTRLLVAPDRPDDDRDEEDEQEEGDDAAAAGGVPPLSDAYSAIDPVSPLLGRRVPKSASASNKTRDRLDELGRHIKSIVKKSVEARQGRDALVRESRSLWSVTPPEDRPLPLGRYSANVRTPITRAAGETLGAYLMEVATGVRPFLKVEAHRDAFTTQASKIESLMDAHLAEKIEYEMFEDELIQQGLRDGTAIAEVCWEYNTRKVRSRKPLTAAIARDAGYELPKNAEPKDGIIVGEAIIRGKRVPVKLGQEWYVDEDVPIVNGPAFKPVDVLDFVMFPSTSKSIESAILVGHAFADTLDGLNHGAKAGLYDPRQIACMVERRPKVVDRMDGGASSIDPSGPANAELDAEEGLSPETPGTLEEDGYLRLWRVIYPIDGDRDGYKEDWEFVFEESTGVVLQARPYPYWHGERNYIAFTPFRRAGRFYGDTLGQVLGEIQNVSDTIVNQSLDLTTLAMVVIAAQKRSSRNKLSTKTLHPGLNEYEVDDQDDIKFHTMPDLHQIGFQSNEWLQRMAEQLTAASETQQGVTSQKSNTLGEINQALQQGNKRLKVLARRLQSSNGKLGQQALGLFRQFLDEKTEYALTRDDGNRIFGDITPAELRAGVLIRAHGDTFNTNETLKMQAAEKIFMMSERSPFINGNPLNLWNAHKRVLEAFPIREVEKIVGTEERVVKDMEEKNSKPEDKLPPEKVGLKLSEAQSLAIFLSMNEEMAPKILKMLGTLDKIGITDREAQDPVEQTQAAQTLAEAEIKAAQTEAQSQLKLKELDFESRVKEKLLELQLKEAESNAKLKAEAIRLALEDDLRETEFRAEQQVAAAKQQAQAQKDKAALKPTSNGNGAKKS
jgi:hypothetical protein